MGKGSGRRPTQISEAEFENNYNRIFRGPQVEPEPACPAIHVTESGTKVRCSKKMPHVLHGVVFDGEDITWADDGTAAVTKVVPRPLGTMCY